MQDMSEGVVLSPMTPAHSGQVEEHGRDGSVEVKYPDGTIRRVFSTGEEEQETPDGTVARRLRDGTETVDYPNGQREVRSELYRVSHQHRN